MKRLLAALLVAALCMSMVGCSAVDYLKASRLYKNGEYAQALPLYEGLNGFADSDQMAGICAQKADYAAAESYLAAQDYEAALPLYEGLGMYADSPLKAVTCRYENGLRYLDNEDYENAIVWLEPLGNYENSADSTSLARWLWLSQQKHSYIIQAVAGDSRVISLEPAEDGTLHLMLERKGHLLGLPYDTLFELTITRGAKEADYEVTCHSESDMTIEESAGGTVELANVTGGKPLQVSSFFQRVIDGEGNETTSNDVTEAIIIRAVMLEAQEQIATYLPKLLENSGVDVTMEELGF